MSMEEKLGKIEIPPMPQVVGKIIQIDENNIGVSSTQMETIIAVDPALSSKILKIANSAFYARSSRVASLSQAITLLGFKTIKSLTLLVSAAGMIPQRSATMEIQKEIWMRSVLSALVGKMVAECTGARAHKDDVFMGTLLKNIGQIYINNHHPDAYSTIFRNSSAATDYRKLRELEQEQFGYTATEVSVYIMQHWNFPEGLVKVALNANFDSDFAALDDLSKRALLGEIIVILKNLTGNIELPVELIEYYTTLFHDFAAHLEMKQKDQDYFLGQIDTDIRGDSFYTFVEELFSM